MPGVRVVTDSACDLTAELAEAAGIIVVPLTIRFGDEELLDRRDLSPTEFWARCKASPSLPETAAPSPGAFGAAFEEAAAAGASGVLCLNLSSGVSATYQSARAGAEAVGDRHPGPGGRHALAHHGRGPAVPGRGGGGGGRCLLRRARGPRRQPDHPHPGLRGAGHPRPPPAGRADRRGPGALGSLLSIKPVVQVKDGVVAEESKQRTRGRSLEYLADKVRADGPLERLAVCSGAAEDVDDFVAMLGGIESAHPMVVTELGPVVGTHAGPGTSASVTRSPPGSVRPMTTTGGGAPPGPTPPDIPRHLAGRPGGPQARRRCRGSRPTGPRRPPTRSDLVVDTIHDKALRPIILGARAVVFGLLVAVLGLTVVTLVSVGLLRLLDVYVFPGRVWASYAVLGLVFSAAGLWAWSQRSNGVVERPSRA